MPPQCQLWRVTIPVKGIVCDGCWEPIFGDRNHCSVCTNYDLCERCDKIVGHNKDHKMIKDYINPRLRWEPEYQHTSVTCDWCNQHPIVGYRFKCKLCLDYDLCASCVKQEVHKHAHNIIQDMDIISYSENLWIRTLSGGACDGCYAPLMAEQGFHCTACPNFDLCKQCILAKTHFQHRGGFINSQSVGMPHSWITCDSCGESPIFGYRFKCKHCDDYDLCSACYRKGVHKYNHMTILACRVVEMDTMQRNQHLTNSFCGIASHLTVGVNHFCNVIMLAGVEEGVPISEQWLSDLQNNCKGTLNEYLLALSALVKLNSDYLEKQLQELAADTGQINASIMEIHKSIQGKNAEIAVAEKRVESAANYVQFAGESLISQQKVASSAEKECANVTKWPMYIPGVNLLYLPFWAVDKISTSKKRDEAVCEMETRERVFEAWQDTFSKEQQCLRNLHEQLKRRKDEKLANEEMLLIYQERFFIFARLNEKLNNAIVQGDKVCNRATTLAEFSEDFFDESDLNTLKILVNCVQQEMNFLLNSNNFLQAQARE